MSRHRRKDNKVLAEALYIRDTDATIRQAAKCFDEAPNTIHRDMRILLPQVSPGLADEIHHIFQRHIVEGRQKGGRNSHGHKKSM